LLYPFWDIYDPLWDTSKFKFKSVSRETKIKYSIPKINLNLKNVSRETGIFYSILIDQLWDIYDPLWDISLGYTRGVGMACILYNFLTIIGRHVPPTSNPVAVSIANT